jgi:hypothetical protein
MASTRAVTMDSEKQLAVIVAASTTPLLTEWVFFLEWFAHGGFFLKARQRC